MTVVDKTKITLTVAPQVTDPTDPTETATVTAVTGPNTSPPTPANILGNQILCDPNMPDCGGNVISTVDGAPPPVQNVVVGQKIVLNTNTNPNLPITPYKTTWTVDGTRIKNYAPTTASASVTELKGMDLAQPNITFYWVYQNSSIPVTVTYQYCVNIPGVGNQCSPVANATFNVSGPTGFITPTYDPGNWSLNGPIPVCGKKKTIYALYFGSLNVAESTSCQAVASSAGITFTASLSDVPSSGGTNAWVQLISSNTLSAVTPTGKQAISNYGTGLDKSFPYPLPLDDSSGNVVNDVPGSGLNTIYATETKDFSANMYLLWTPQISGSIPVPIGYVSWTISATADQNVGQSPPWAVADGATATATFTVSTDTGAPTHGLPTWKRVVTAASAALPSDVEPDPVQMDGEEENQ